MVDGLLEKLSPLTPLLPDKSVPLFLPRRRGGGRHARKTRAVGRMADEGLLEAVRGLHLAHPELGPKPLLAKLRQQQPTWQRATRRCARRWRR